MTKTKYHHGNLKKTFLKIAFEFIEENDIDDLTLKTLSEITGTSRSAIYSHFDSKEALIEAMILNGFHIFDGILSPILGNSDIPLLQRFELAAKDYIGFAKDNKVLYRLLFGNKYAHIRMDVMTKNDPDHSGFGSLVLAIEEGQRSGLFKKVNAYQQAVLVWSSLHGLASLLIDGFVGIEEMYDALFEDLLVAIQSGLLLK